MFARLTACGNAAEIARKARVFSHDGPIRIDAGIIWGQGKAAAEADCQRRLKEIGRCPEK